jgi:hypothetical protein
MRFPRLATAAIRALSMVALATATAGAQVIVRTGTLGSGPLFDSPNFGITPPPSTTFGLAQFYFDAFPFTVGQTSLYSFNSTATFDPAIFLYSTSFNPAAPLTNIIFGASNVPFFDNPGLPLATGLTAGTQYVLVTSSFDIFATGSFTSTISRVGVVPEPTSLLLTASGMLLVGFAVRRRNKRVSQAP